MFGQLHWSHVFALHSLLSGIGVECEFERIETQQLSKIVSNQSPNSNRPERLIWWSEIAKTDCSLFKKGDVLYMKLIEVLPHLFIQL